jgi:hypothetical protein
VKFGAATATGFDRRYVQSPAPQVLKNSKQLHKSTVLKVNFKTV